MADLSVELCGVKLKNPVIAASGTFGFGREFDELYDIGVLGGVSTKGLTPRPRQGNPVPRIAEARGVILNAVGLQNPGVEHFIENDLAWLKGKGTAVIANVAGSTLEEYAGICARLDGLADIVELNISCPNVKRGGMAFGIRPESVREVTAAAKAALKSTPLMVKLSPNVESIAANAAAAEEGGADAVSLVNTFTGMAIDVERRRPCSQTTRGAYRGRGSARLRCAWCSRRHRRCISPSWAWAGSPAPRTRWNFSWRARRPFRWAPPILPTPWPVRRLSRGLAAGATRTACGRFPS